MKYTQRGDFQVCHDTDVARWFVTGPGVVHADAINEKKANALADMLQAVLETGREQARQEMRHALGIFKAPDD